ncbi:hypothetical protein Pst134EB_001623 [Puccinia striiformis f. sp. tritici]|nr:hypothetical protein Pst134EB_001623 [Puccinia striiformis f. sp. tritici]
MPHLHHSPHLTNQTLGHKESPKQTFIKTLDHTSIRISLMPKYTMPKIPCPLTILTSPTIPLSTHQNHYRISTAPQPPMAEETTWQHQHPDHHSKTQSTSPKIIPQMPGISLEHTAPNLSTELDCLVVDRPEYRKKIVVNQEEEAGVQNMDLGANLRVDASLPEMKSDRAPKFGIGTREKPEVLTSEGIEQFDYIVGQPMDPPPAYCFQSMEDLKDFTSKWALAHEYRLPTKSSNKNKNITLHCSLNGEDTTPAVDTTSPFNPRTRGLLNKQIGCPFVMTGSGLKAAGTVLLTYVMKSPTSRSLMRAKLKCNTCAPWG